MTNGVLYFPYIRVPESPWFTRVLLYWDQVGSIVPAEFVSTPEKLGSYMQELVQVELVKQVFPDHYVYDIPNFARVFLELIDSNPAIRNAQRADHRNWETTQIHIAKFGKELASQLCKRNLAKH